MATASGRSAAGLAGRLFAEPHDFDFFQAVRLLLRLRRAAGGDGEEVDRAVRFAAALSLAFPASAIDSLNTGSGVPPPVMAVAFMGLTGPLGVLPWHYTDELLARDSAYRERLRRTQAGAAADPTEPSRAFLDMFNHRLIALFYRAWEKYHYEVGYERDRNQPFARYLLDLVGLGGAGLQGRLRRDGHGVDDQTLAYYGGLLAQRPHSCAALAALLNDYLGVAVTVEQFRGRWLCLAREHRSWLGPEARNNVLGETLVLGDRVWDRQSGFRVRLGPLSRDEFDAYLPDAEASFAARGLIRFFAGPALDFDLQPVLKRSQVPPLELGAGSARLGWSTWISNRDFDWDADDAVFPALE